jgi:hypothetical protein
LLHSQRPNAYAPYDNALGSPIASQPGEDTSLVSISDRIPCLFNYEVRPISVTGDIGPAEYLPIMDSFSFCSMCFVHELVRMRVGGLKIAGRCASEEFQERTTRYYRHLVDLARAEDMASTKQEIQRLRVESPELMKLCINKRCYYAPWSGKARESFPIPFMDRLITLLPIVQVGAATTFSTIVAPVELAGSQGDGV